MRQVAALIVLLAAGLPARATGLPDNAVLDFNGLGPLRIGMRIGEVSALALPFEPPIASSDEQGLEGCFQVSLQQMPDVVLMFEDGRLVRIDAYSATVRTAEGLGIGSRESDVIATYGESRVVVEPHHYAPPPHHYLKHFSSDNRRAIVFETDGPHVDEFRVGEAEPSQYVEGCL